MVGVAALLVAMVPAGASPGGTAPSAPGKASAPSTNLKDYPKLAVSKVRPATVTGAHHGVVAIVKHANGITSARSYTPAPGVSDAKLYQNLKAAGIRGLQNPATVTPNSADDCSWGSAVTINCPPLHWANNGYAHPQVYFVDHTSSNWPVNAATLTWNQTVGIDSGYVYGSCPGFGGTHCINTDDADYGDSGQWAGVVALTYYSWDSNYNFVDGAVNIQYNDFPRGLTADGFRQTTCQEQGHALGMGHNGATDSCMYAYIINSSSALYPDSNDFSQLANVYSVAH